MRRASRNLATALRSSRRFSPPAATAAAIPATSPSPRPEFTISDGTHSVDLSKLRGHIVVLNLWATNCAPCIEELPSLLALQRQMPDLAVVAVSWDEDPAAYQRFLTRHHVDLLTIRDPDQKVAALYGTSRSPRPTSSTARASSAANSSPPRTGPAPRSSTTSAPSSMTSLKFAQDVPTHAGIL